MVEPSIEHVEAVRVRAIRSEAERLVVVQGAAMETIQRRKAVGVQATHLCRAAHCGYTVTQSCKETGQTINVQLVQATRLKKILKCPAEVKLQQMNKSHKKRVSLLTCEVAGCDGVEQAELLVRSGLQPSSSTHS